MNFSFEEVTDLIKRTTIQWLEKHTAIIDEHPTAKIPIIKLELTNLKKTIIGGLHPSATLEDRHGDKIESTITKKTVSMLEEYIREGSVLLLVNPHVARVKGILHMTVDYQDIAFVFHRQSTSTEFSGKLWAGIEGEKINDIFKKLPPNMKESLSQNYDPQEKIEQDQYFSDSDEEFMDMIETIEQFTEDVEHFDFNNIFEEKMEEDLPPGVQETTSKEAKEDEKSEKYLEDVKEEDLFSPF